jgi:ribonuclease P protein component
LFPKSSRILRSADFRHVYDHGFRVSGSLLAAFCLARPDGAGKTVLGPRLGLTVPKAVGNAVARNRIKRRIREAFRLRRAGLDIKWDIVVNPRRAIIDAPFDEIERALGKVMQRCNSC